MVRLHDKTDNTPIGASLQLTVSDVRKTNSSRDNINLFHDGMNWSGGNINCSRDALD
jgi:hypothetical protein